MLAFIAKRLYRARYLQLMARLVEEYNELNGDVMMESNYENLTKLLISGEDHRFNYHIGFDLIAICRAVRNKVLYNKVEGASTIEQQLVRVLTDDFEKTLQRKVREILLSTTLTSIVPKAKIPLLYLNVAYYGSGMVGLNQAIKKLGIDEDKKITVDQAAEIVSRLKYPEPLTASVDRHIQIEKRKHHLISLYSRHNYRKYFKVYG